jgi:hypothetical protein
VTMDDALTVLDETGRWRARNVRYVEGTWDRLRDELPEFKKEDFRVAEDAPANPYLHSVVRLPRRKMERAIPVGVVSKAYTLAQHREVAEKCLEGIREAGIELQDLRCQVGLTELGEWMNLRVYFPESYDFGPGDGEPLGLRLECFNSVDGSSRLVLLLGWLRFVCSNGMIIGETKAELKAIHNQQLDLTRIPHLVCEGMEHVEQAGKQLASWEKETVASGQLRSWVNGELAGLWGKKAACRTFHICNSGHDVELADPFEGGEPADKEVRKGELVPGAPRGAKNLYQVSQALAWLASSRTNSDERVLWQSQVAQLIARLKVTPASA